MSIQRAWARISFTGRTKTRVLRQIQRLIASNVPLARSLDMLQALYSRGGKRKDDPVAIAAAEWRERLNEGVPLSRCLRGWVTTAEEMIIEAGEEGGNLDTAFGEALNASRVSSEIRRTVMGGLAYPALLFGVLIFALFGFSNEIVPTFSAILDPGMWTGNAAIMYEISAIVTEWMLPILGILGGLATFAIVSLPRLTGPARTFLDRLPPWSIYKVVQGASFMISLRGFLNAGVPVPEALRRMARASNPYTRSRILAILDEVNMGRNLGEAMMATGHNFPDPHINGEISIYAGLDNFVDALDLLAREWIENSIQRAKDSAKVLSNLLLVILASTIGFMATSLFELQDLITQAAG